MKLPGLEIYLDFFIMEHPGYFLLDVATKTADFKFLCFLKGK